MALLKVKCSPESVHRPDSREIKVGKCVLLQNQRLLALRSRQQRSPLQEEPSRTMKKGGPSPRPEGAWPSLQTPAPGQHLPGRTDLEAAKCTCSFYFPSFTLVGMVPRILARPPSLPSARGWVKGVVGRDGSFQVQPSSPSLCDLGCP